MKIISFGYMADAFLAGAKTVTRRDWKASHAASFHVGDYVQAWNKAPYAGGRQIGIIEITRPLIRQSTGDMVDDEYVNEGFAWMARQGLVMPKGSPWSGEHPAVAFERWSGAGILLWVVQFRTMVLTP